MYLIDLADAARKSGLTVIEQPGWKSRGHGQMAAVNSILLHHTAGPKTGDAPSLMTVQNGRPDLAGPLAHLVLARTGIVYVVAAGLCWHAGDVLAAWQTNAYSIGIEAEHDGVSVWPDTEYKAYLKLVRALLDHYNLPVSKALGHKEAARPAGRKIDPNFSMPAFRAALSTTAQAPSTSSTLITIKRGDTGPAVERIQRWLGVANVGDPGYGTFGPATETAVIAYQKMRGITADGVVGPTTYKEMGLT